MADAAVIRGKEKPLWTCPKCGHRFVTRNLWHSCGRYAISDHFVDKDAIVSDLFDRFHALVRECGPVTVYAQKTRIVFQVRVRFAGVTARKHWLEGTIWLKRRVDDERFYRIDSLTPHDHVHYFRLKEFADIDPGLRAIVEEAYLVGCQERIARPARDDVELRKES